MSDSVTTPEDEPKLWKRWAVVVIALFALIAVFGYLLEAEDTIDVVKYEDEPLAPVVTVERVSLKPETVEVSAYAEVYPRWMVELKAAVSGRVEKVFDTALAGERVDEGTELLTIEHSQYMSEVAAAELALKEAQLGLTNAKNDTRLARRQYKRDGIKPPNDLALLLPQLRIAESAVSSAKARLSAAKKQLEDTKVSAPFSGFITERLVSPGQSVSAGEALLKLVDDRQFELTVELGRRDWLLLKQPLEGATASLFDQQGKALAQARVRRGGGFLDEKTRQYRVFLEVEGDGSDAVLSGDFVKVVLPGKSVDAALNIPESSLTQEGYVWYVDAENQLQRMEPKVLFRKHNRILVESPVEDEEWQVAVTPLVSFLPGQTVRPQLKGE